MAVTKIKALGSDDFPSADQTFDFTITLTYPQGTTDAQKALVSVADSTSTSAATLSRDYSTASAKLKVGEILKVTNLPDGTTYVIAEGDVPENYTKVTTTGLSGTIDVSTAATKDIAKDFANSYTKPVEYGAISITKEVTGDVTDPSYDNTIEYTVNVKFSAGGTYKVTLPGATDATDVEFDADTVKAYTLKDQDVLLIEQVPVGVDYTVTEEDIAPETAAKGYAKGTITNDSGTVAKDTTAVVTVGNTYTKPIPVAELTLSKVVENPDQASIPASFKIAVRVGDGNDYIQDENGTIGADIHYFDVAPGADVTIQNVPVGTTVHIDEDRTAAKSTEQDVQLKVTGTTELVIDADSTKNVAEVTNTYTRLVPKTLSITKTIVGGATTTAPYSFTVSTTDAAGAVKYLQADGTLGDAAITFTVTTDTPKTITIDESAVGYTYTVNEDTTNVPEIGGYTFDAAGSTTSGSAEISATVTSGAVDLINKYDKVIPKKEISISKVDATNSKEIAGAELTLYSVDAAGKLTKLTSWTSSATEVYKFTIEAGNYAIEETIAPEGYQKKTSLVKFNLSFDAEGNAVTKVTEGPGKYDAANDRIVFENDPIKVTTGKLSVHVVEEKTGRDVPDAEVKVEYPDGTEKTFKTNDKGEIVDEKGKTPIDVPAGKYKVTVVKVPDGYEVTTGETGTVDVPENGSGRHEAKILPKTGGLTILVLEEGTNRVVPGATVEVEAPEGKTFPDGSTKIIVTTDKDGKVTSYQGKDGKTIDLTTGLEPGDYKITVTKVPDGYKVSTGQTSTVTVKKGEVAEHVALISTADKAPDTPSAGPNTPSSSTTPKTPATTTSVNTGDSMNVVPYIIIMVLALAGIIIVIFRKRRTNK